MAYDECITPSLDDFSKAQLYDLTESSATRRVLQQLIQPHSQNTRGYFDEECGEYQAAKHWECTKFIEQAGRRRRVEIRAWLDDSESPTRMENYCEKEVAVPYAAIPVRHIGIVTMAKAYGAANKYPHLRTYEFFEISDDYSELNGGTVITYHKRVLSGTAQFAVYQQVGSTEVLDAASAVRLSETLVHAHFEGEDI